MKNVYKLNAEKTKYKDKNNKLKRNIIVIFLITFVLQIIFIFNNSIWGDEAFTILTVKSGWRDFWDIIIGDVHPPLYYLILKLTLSLVGYKVFLFKFLSIIPIFMLNMIVLKYILKEEKLNYYNVILSILYFVITTLTTNFLLIGIEVRMYSWALFFVTMSGIYAFKLTDKVTRKDMFIFILFSLAAALTHYFALVCEIIIYLLMFLFLLLKKENIKYILSIIVLTILGYLWWIPSFINQFRTVRNNYWITFSPRNVLGYIRGIMGFKENIVLTFMIFLVIVILVCITLYKTFYLKIFNKKEKREILFALCSISLPFWIILIGTILNILIRPIFNQRYLIPALGLFWIGVLILLKYSYNLKWLRLLFISFITILVINDYHLKFIDELQNGTKEALIFMKKNLADNDIIITNIDQLYYTILEYYFPNNDRGYFSLGDDQVNISQYDLVNSGANIIWLFEDKYKEIDKKTIMDNGYKIKKMFTGDIDNRYFFHIYKLEQ